MIQAKGVNGQITFDGTFITIARKGFRARATIGKGEKRFPVGQVTAVQWKPPGPLMNGFISFTLSGGVEKQSKFGNQTSTALQDENSVLVSKGAEAQFLALRTAIEESIAARYATQPAPTGIPSAVPPPPPSVPAGWYPNPEGVGQRYWDGARWTEHTAPRE